MLPYCRSNALSHSEVVNFPYCGDVALLHRACSPMPYLTACVWLFSPRSDFSKCSSTDRGRRKGSRFICMRRFAKLQADHHNLIGCHGWAGGFTGGHSPWKDGKQTSNHTLCSQFQQLQIITLDRFPHKILKGLCGCFARSPPIPARRCMRLSAVTWDRALAQSVRLHQTRHCESLPPQITDQTHWIQISKFCSKYLFHIICISSLHPNPKCRCYLANNEFNVSLFRSVVNRRHIQCVLNIYIMASVLLKACTSANSLLALK